MNNDTMRMLERLAAAAEGIQEQLRRLADHFDPPPSGIVDTQYVADRLECTNIHVARLARQVVIPKSCVLVGTGNGKPWKFYRSRLDKWLATR